MKSLSQIIAWLKTPEKLPVILVEIPGILPGSLTLYLSSAPFSSGKTDLTLPNITYNSSIVGGIEFKETLNITGGISLNYGDIEIDNTAGDKDSWLYDYVWVNKNIQILLGDATWNRDDFRPIFNGVILDISSRAASTLNIVITDKLQKLNNPISEDLLADINSNSEVLIPVTFGEAFNVTPITSSTLVNTLEYQVHTGPIEDIIEVRDNGVPVSVTKSVSTGKFTLSQSPYGQITCSVQGDKNPTYYNDIANIIKRIVKSYGPVDTRLLDADIDLTNFSNFSAANTQPVGVFIFNKENILTTCNFLANSVGAHLTFSSAGLLKLVKLDLPASGGSTYDVTANDFEYNSLSISSKLEVRASTKIGYCKNYAIQEGTIAAGVPSHNVEVFEDEYLYESITDTSVQSIYKLTKEAEEEQTALLVKADAITEATRRNALWKVPRFIITFKAYGHLLPVELGDTVNITDSRFELEATKSGMVVEVSRDWLGNRVTIGVLV